MAPCGRVTALDVAVFAAFVGMGLGSWIAVNGIFQVLPVISLTAPPAYNISVIESYAALLVAGANVYPVLYLVLLGYLPCLRGNGRRKLCVDRWTLVVMMVVLGAGSCGLLAAFWDFSDDAGALLFFFLIFQASGTDCMTSVLFYPICSGFPAIFVSALIIGETGTSVIAAILSAAQVDGLPYGETRFSVTVFFVILAVVCAVSAACAVLLYAAGKSYTPQALGRRGCAPPASRAVTLIETSEAAAAADVAVVAVGGGGDDDEEDDGHAKHRVHDGAESGGAGDEGGLSSPPSAVKGPRRARRGGENCCSGSGSGSGSGGGSSTALLWSVLAGQAVVSLVENGVLASVTANTLVPFGNRTTHLVEVTQQVSAVVAAASTLLAFWKHPNIADAAWVWATRGGAWLGLLGAVLICGAYVFTAAAVPLGTPVAAGAGSLPPMAAVTPALLVLTKGLCVYTKSAIFLAVHDFGSREQAKLASVDEFEGTGDDDSGGDNILPEPIAPRLLRWGGVGIQIGDVIGAVGCFVLNVDLHFFNSAY